jgi:hypothetical protein
VGCSRSRAEASSYSPAARSPNSEVANNTFKQLADAIDDAVGGAPGYARLITPLRAGPRSFSWAARQGLYILGR